MTKELFFIDINIFFYFTKFLQISHTQKISFKNIIYSSCESKKACLNYFDRFAEDGVLYSLSSLYSFKISLFLSWKIELHRLQTWTQSLHARFTYSSKINRKLNFYPNVSCDFIAITFIFPVVSCYAYNLIVEKMWRVIVILSVL